MDSFCIHFLRFQVFNLVGLRVPALALTRLLPIAFRYVRGAFCAGCLCRRRPIA